uniref:Uncharacterized protein n=1 Tax=Anguilla anguilla TaxID=7936 RepID=A0A0E9P679_ANGAN
MVLAVQWCIFLYRQHHNLHLNSWHLVVPYINRELVSFLVYCQCLNAL